MSGAPKSFRNGESVALADVRAVARSAFRDLVTNACEGGGRLAALVPIPAEGGHDLVAVVFHDARHGVSVIQARVADGQGYPSLTPALPAAQAHERALFEEGIRPHGHPWLKPLRRHAALEAPGPDRAPEYPFFVVDGPGLHEVAVGPVHAGIIEPGHFRFQCSGETVHHLEIHLGYQHRGAEALLRTASPARARIVAEAIAGDTVIGHGWAQCRAREALAGVEAPPAAGLLRSVALELERLSNHVGDLGALCNDVGYLPGASWFSRLRGEFLNALADLSGNRFGRGLLVPGGVRRLPGAELRRKLLARLAVAGREVHEVATLTFGAASVLARFERAGVVERVVADEIGLTGPCARASGCDRDVRRDHPLEGYAASSFPVSLGKDGDVYARALVRWLEIGTSLEWVRWGLETLPEGPASVPVPAPAPSRLAVAAVEGWRGEIVHVLATGPDGALTAAHVVDPSLRNWFGLAMALRGNPISDFPLCNKSFNLSYCGHDL